MPLISGARLGPYEILSPLGAGGMGEVYRARDSKLNRDVAIKILPEALAADPAARARFEREAQAVAALSHPNILGIFDFGVEGGTPYAVTELLEGGTLRERLADGVVPPRKAIEYAVQIATGLAAAHARGITHRDLKPENVFLTRDGRVKILDFGLAKVGAPDAAGAAASQTLTPTFHVTSPGAVLGTVGYMSPEQVRGQEVDHRTDIFSFGVILYELLAGHRAFMGDSAVETMNAILKEDPPELTRAKASLPPALDRVVRRCLEKNPDERFQSARDLAFALEALSGSGISAASAAAVTSRGRRWLRPVAASIALAGALAVGLAVGRSTSIGAGAAAISFETKTFDPQMIFNARFAPDGQTIVFSAALEGSSPELFVSRPGSVAPQPLGVRRTHLLSISAKNELAVLTDVRFINHRLFEGTLARMPIDGAPRPWLEHVREADWSPDGSTLAVIRVNGLQDQIEYPVGKLLYQTAGYVSDARVSPDGNQVAFFDHPVRFDDRGWVKVVDRGGAVRTVAGEYWGEEGLAWSQDGDTILFAATGFGVDGYQPRAVAASGLSEPRLALPTAGSVYVFDIARDGRWLISRNDDRLSIRALLPGASAEQEFPWLGSALSARLSRDGKLLLFTDQSQSAGANYAVSLRKTDGSPVVRLGEGNALDISPDSKWALAALTSPPRIVIYPIGAGDPVRLNPGGLERVTNAQWFPDGKRVLACGNEPGRPSRCYEQDLAGGLPKPFTPEGLAIGPMAPDGRTVVATTADGAIQLLPLAGGATRPAVGTRSDDVIVAWSHNGQSLFVRRAGDVPLRLERVDLTTGQRVVIRELAPPDRSGLIDVTVGSVLDDGGAYAYTYWRRVSTLFVVKGAR